MSSDIATKPIGRRKRSHDVAEEIEKLIDAGEFSVGTQLPSEKDLALRFGVGRPAVREALFLLGQQGLIETTNGARARVTPPTPKLIAQQLAAVSKRLATQTQGQEQVEQARLILEAGLAWRAAQLASDEDIRGLKAKLDANIAAAGNAVEFIRTDIAFHYELAVICRNPIFTTVHEVLVEWLIDQRTTSGQMPDAELFSIRDHTAIYEAVAAREPMRAFHEMASHLQLVSRLYHEAKRLSETILRGAMHDVAQRFEKEKLETWKSLVSSGRAGLASQPVQKQEAATARATRPSKPD